MGTETEESVADLYKKYRNRGWRWWIWIKKYRNKENGGGSK
jgi:hypothetical protein